MRGKYKVAIVGSSGLVGRTVLRVLEEKNFPNVIYTLFSSKNSANKKVSFLGEDYIFCELNEDSFNSHFDFAIARSHKSAERFIKVVNNMDLNAARNIIFAWNDTRDMRQHEAKLYAFIQSSDKKVSDDAIGALKEYSIHPALWTEKDKYISELTA